MIAEADTLGRAPRRWADALRGCRAHAPQKMRAAMEAAFFCPHLILKPGNYITGVAQKSYQKGGLLWCTKGLCCILSLVGNTPHREQPGTANRPQPEPPAQVRLRAGGDCDWPRPSSGDKPPFTSPSPKRACAPARCECRDTGRAGKKKESRRARHWPHVATCVVRIKAAFFCPYLILKPGNYITEVAQKSHHRARFHWPT